MGMQGPLTAQALGRSPYDEVVDGEGVDDAVDVEEPAQQYDHRGRPINPETKRMNRDIIRAHNEVMLVIGVAEPENPSSGPEVESQRRHAAYEESIGVKLVSSARRCVDSVGIFGVHGLRQRILIYKRYSHIPFWELFQRSRKDFSLSRDILSGAAGSFLTNYVERSLGSWWFDDKEKRLPRRILYEVWSYLRVHLELYVALQRLGMTSNTLWLPRPSFFIPFTQDSPIPAPPPPEDFTLPSLLSWVGGALISSTPFLVWVMTQKMIQDWKPAISAQIFKHLPNTFFQGRAIPPPRPPPFPPPPPPRSTNSAPADAPAESLDRGDERRRPREEHDGTMIEHTTDTTIVSQSGQAETSRRASVFSTRGDEYPSDDEETEGVSATLISFDVEASESQDAPPGLWSAELRPSTGPDPRLNGVRQPVYLDTLLTQLPALVAAYLFTDVAMSIIMAPYEATALRLVARMIRARQGLPCWDIYNMNMFSGLTSTSVINFLGAELLHVTLSSEVWAVFAFLSQWFHMTEEDWKTEDEKA